MEAVILAGGFGTRLQTVVKDVPKPMADVNGRPFLCYVLDFLTDFGVNRLILSTGYKKEQILEYFGGAYKGAEIVYSPEDTPLGTGGAIKQAFTHCDGDNVFVLNGDTFFGCDLTELLDTHKKNNADITLALKTMYDFDRYGHVVTQNGRVTAFNEKQFVKEGCINGGIYVIRKNIFDRIEMPAVFSFETDLLMRYVNQLKICSLISDSYFIDIGVPSDYAEAQTHFKKISGQKNRMDK